jgi:hypothetical protein
MKKKRISIPNLTKAELLALDYTIARAQESRKAVLTDEDLAGSWHLRFIVNLRQRQQGMVKIDKLSAEDLKRLFSEVPREGLSLKDLIGLRKRIQKLQ